MEENFKPISKKEKNVKYKLEMLEDSLNLEMSKRYDKI